MSSGAMIAWVAVSVVWLAGAVWLLFWSYKRRPDEYGIALGFARVVLGTTAAGFLWVGNMDLACLFAIVFVAALFDGLAIKNCNKGGGAKNGF